METGAQLQRLWTDHAMSCCVDTSFWSQALSMGLCTL